MGLLISQLDQAPAPNAAAQKIYNETSINPMFNPNHMVANRAVGSTTRFNRLSVTQKEVEKEMFGPAESHLNKQIHFSPIKESSIHTKLDEIRDAVKTNQKRQEMTTPQSEFT